MIGAAQQQFPGYRLRLSSSIEAHHDRVRFSWSAGGLYRGAFQFTRSTWGASPKSPGGDPIAYPYKTQAVVAILLMHRDGTQHWPVCG